MKCIEVLKEKKPIQKIPLTDKTFIIGRLHSADIPLDSPNISPQQAKIVKDADYIMVYNLGKPNTLLVNGRRVKSTVLDFNDVITIGDYTIQFAEGQEKEPEDSISELRQKIHHTLIEKMDLKKVRIDEFEDQELWRRCELLIDSIIGQTKLPPGVNAEKLKKDILHEALGLGPLEDLLEDDTISEIMVNKKDSIYIERGGKLYLTDLSFSSDEDVVNIISRIVNPIGRRIDKSVAMVDARLKDGSRINGIIPPLSIQGPMITIRKFAKKMFADDDLINFGAVTREIMEFLKICVKIKKNMVISGGTGSGKTCFLNVLSSYIPPEERIITIEDSAELRLPHGNIGSLEARPPNIEGKGQVTIRDLVRNALRMRPDRIIVGECRGGETIDMLQAMNTGHDGSLTTIHANSTSDAIIRMETMVMMSGLELPITVIRREIASAIHIIVQQARFTDGSRKITCISEIAGLNGDDMNIKDIFVFKRRGIGKDGKVLGDFVATGYMPGFIDELEIMGLHISKDIFQEGRQLK